MIIIISYPLGTFVIIKKGQTMLLDMDTPVLKVLLIKGGTFMFDDEKDIHLSAENILITEGGQFLVGSAEQPYQHRALITVHGHVRSKELPVYGAKSLSLREGFLGLYGKHIPHTWTYLAATANPDDTSITLTQPATGWNINDEIVITATAKSIRENEVVIIIDISPDGKTIEFGPPLKYKHISIEQTIAGRRIETRAEVGLLTRNVVVEGSVEESWVHTIENCPAEFDPGQFATQTCFDGRFGEERGTDQFGVQIMIHAHHANKHKVTNRRNFSEM